MAGGSFFKDGTTLIKIVEPPDPARLLGLKADRPDPKPAEAATGQPGKKTAPERFEDSVADAVNSMIPHVERLVESWEREKSTNVYAKLGLVNTEMDRLNQKFRRDGLQGHARG